MKGYVNAEELVKKLQARIDAFVARNPEKENGEEVETIRELIQMVRREAEND